MYDAHNFEQVLDPDVCIYDAANFVTDQWTDKPILGVGCCFVAIQFLLRIYALFWRTFYRPKKYGGVPKMTIIRYGFLRSKNAVFYRRQICVWGVRAYLIIVIFGTPPHFLGL